MVEKQEVNYGAKGEETVGLPAKTIDEFSTDELVDALAGRPEAEISYVSSSAFVSLDIDGPAAVLVVRRDG